MSGGMSGHGKCYGSGRQPWLISSCVDHPCGAGKGSLETPYTTSLSPFPLKLLQFSNKGVTMSFQITLAR